MRELFLAALVVPIALSSTLRAEDAPKGAIGIKLKIDDGKMVIAEAIKDSPAEKAGIKSNDVLLKVNDFQAKDKIDSEDFREMVKELGKHKPGEKIKLTIKRGEKEMVVEVTVGKRSEVLKEVEE